MSIKVSVIIPSYNRFEYLKRAIQSVHSQTYPVHEIIVVNDCSKQEEYYKEKLEGCKVIHLDINSKTVCGRPAPGYVRNFGLKIATGDYVAFLDDDDIWFQEKVEHQLKHMEQTKTKMSSTEAVIGKGFHDESKQYKKYHTEHHLRHLIETIGSSKLPSIWDANFLRIHNFVITSTVMLHMDVVKRIGFMNDRSRGEDYDYWLRSLDILGTCSFIETPYIYHYDAECRPSTIIN